MRLALFPGLALLALAGPVAAQPGERFLVCIEQRAAFIARHL